MSSYLRAQLIGLLAVEALGVVAFYGEQRWVVGTLFIVAVIVTAIRGYRYDRRKRAELDDDL